MQTRSRFPSAPGLAALLCVAGCAGPLPPRPATQPLEPGASWLRAADAHFELCFEAADFALEPEAFESWISAAASAVAAYYGRFPLERSSIELKPVRGTGVESGVTWVVDGQGRIHVRLGAQVTRAELERDWVLTHEMVHLCMPQLPPEQHWLEEGLATYVEPIARARLGQESAASVWRQLVEGLPQGQARAGDAGLDGAQRWGRIYWGGALFCLLADVGLREATHNRIGLQQVLRQLALDGDSLGGWTTIDAWLEAADAVAGLAILSELYAQHARQPVEVDLERLWQRLGVVLRGRQLVFDEGAPLAHIRRAITAAG